MKQTQNCMVTLLALLVLGMTARAQDTSTRTQDAPTREASRVAGPVTISVTEHGVRFAALGSFGKMRLEVFNADGASLYNSDFAAASVRDWVLDDKYGQRLPDGTYLCVITLRDLSGRMSTKQGSVVLLSGQPSLKLPDGESVEVVEPDKSLTRVTDPPNTALTLLGHDGENGQVVNTRRALTFRFGDFFGGKDKEVMRLTEEGNLGIGTAKPRFKLDVVGAIRARQGFVFNDGSMLNINDQGALTLSNSDRQSTLTLTNGGGTVTPNVAGTGTQNYIAKWAETGGAGTLQNSGIFETAGGNVGIGTTGPLEKLDLGGALGTNGGNIILGTYNATASRYLGVGSGTAGAFGAGSGFSGIEFGPPQGTGEGYLAFHTHDYGVGSNEKMRIDKSGNIGIGTTNPATKLDLVGGFRAIVSSLPAFSLLSGNTSTSPAILLQDGAATPNQWLLFSGLNSATDGIFGIQDRRQSAMRMMIDTSGNVGIGTSNPQSRLDVNGNVNVVGNATISGNIAAKYQDIAEWTSARSQLPSGTVVSLDTLTPNSVMASNRPYDTRVAGVVSAQPGVILGEGGPNRVLVATTGRVKVRVNANHYPIHIGDLLVTSDTPGVAMKSQPFRLHGKTMHRPGTIIGKALESLSSGEGQILVLLSLQ